MFKLLKKIPYWYVLAIPYLLFILGMAMNGLVMARNHGQMPVLGCGTLLPNAGDEGDWQIHVCMNQATHLKFLADWIVINGMGVMSPGDLPIYFWEYVSPYITAIWGALIVIRSMEK